MLPQQSGKMMQIGIVPQDSSVLRISMDRSFILVHIVSQTSINAAVDQSTNDEIKARIKSKIECCVIHLAVSIFQAKNTKSEADKRSRSKSRATFEWAERGNRTRIGCYRYPYARKSTVGGGDYGAGREGAGVGDGEGKGCEDAFVDEGGNGEVWGVVEMG
ncbi:hypothetical protein EAF00_004413 [Botryotinia globosa]|nr:hypothetical protein EAF00_004413 [Botryotinia globosa]